MPSHEQFLLLQPFGPYCAHMQVFLSKLSKTIKLQLTYGHLDLSCLHIEEDFVIGDGGSENAMGLSTPLISTNIYTFEWCTPSPFSYGLTPQFHGQSMCLFNRTLVCTATYAESVNNTLIEFYCGS